MADPKTHVIPNDPLNSAVTDLLNVAISEVWSLGGWDAVAGYTLAALLRSMKSNGAEPDAIVSGIGAGLYNLSPDISDEDIDRVCRIIRDEAKAQQQAGNLFITTQKGRA